MTLPRRVFVAYGIGQLGWAILVNLVGFWLIYVYRPPAEAGLPLLVVPVALSVIAGGGRLFDAVTDPVVAKLSDESSFGRGRRTPFMALGALPAAAACALLFVPPVPAVSTTNVVWLAVVSVVFYLALTLYGTPYFALLAELGDRSERIDLATAVAVGWAGGLVIAGQASGIWSAVDAATALGRPAAVQATVVGLAALAALCMYVPVVVIDERTYADPQPSSRALVPTLKAFARNRDFTSYVVADFAYFAGLTLVLTGMPFYTTVLLFADRPDFGEALVGQLILAVVLTWVVVYPIVNLAAKRVGKKPLIRAAFAGLGVVFCAITVLGWLPLSPLAQAFGVAVLAGIPMAVLSVLPHAALADVARVDALETGDPQEGMFFAGRTLAQKLGQSVGLFAFPALTILGDQPGDALGIRLSGVVGAALCLAAFVGFRYYREAWLTDRLRTLDPVAADD